MLKQNALTYVRIFQEIEYARYVSSSIRALILTTEAFIELTLSPQHHVSMYGNSYDGNSAFNAPCILLKAGTRCTNL
jgi:hypothetical protein